MNNLIKVEIVNDRQTVLGKGLHKFLEVKTTYLDWMKRMIEYGFVENSDFEAITEKKVTAQGNETTFINHQLTLSMAKELSMIQRTDRGKQARQYFIKCEEELKNQLQQPKIMTLKESLQLNLRLLEDNEKLQLQLEETTEVKELLMHSGKLYTITEIAKELHIRSARDLNQFLKDRKIQYYH